MERQAVSNSGAVGTLLRSGLAAVERVSHARARGRAGKGARSLRDGSGIRSWASRGDSLRARDRRASPSGPGCGPVSDQWSAAGRMEREVGSNRTGAATPEPRVEVIQGSGDVWALGQAARVSGAALRSVDSRRG